MSAGFRAGCQASQGPVLASSLNFGRLIKPVEEVLIEIAKSPLNSNISNLKSIFFKKVKKQRRIFSERLKLFQERNCTRKQKNIILTQHDNVLYTVSCTRPVNLTILS